MNGQVKHTATPYIVEHDGVSYKIIDQDGRIVAATYSYSEKGKERANAIFIETACNAHDELVHVVENALTLVLALQKVAQDAGHPFSSEVIPIWEAFAQDALTNAKTFGKEISFPTKHPDA